MTETPVATESDLQAAVRLIQEAHRIVVTAHVNPDADAIGSVLGLVHGLRALGKEARGVLADPVPLYACFLSGAGELSSDKPEPGWADAIIYADSAGIDRVGSVYLDEPAVWEAMPSLNLDHHRTNPLFGSVNYVDPGASSTSELAYRLLRALHVPITAEIANPLLFGIVGDTGSFRNGATTPGALEVAACLVESGADTQRISFQLFECKTFAAARLWGKIVSTVDLDRPRHIVFAHMSQEMLRSEGASVDETEGVAEYLRGIEEAEVVMLLKETPQGEMRVSMRSRPEIDASAIATRLGGGGHRQAAGCTIAGPVDAAKAALIAAFDALNPR